MIWLWKELREHRLLLVQLALSIPIVTALALFGIRTEIVPSQRFVDGCSLLGLGLGIAVLAPALIVREMTLDHVTFLRRTPRGTGPALAAKLAVLFAGVLALALHGHLCGRLSWSLLSPHPVEYAWNVGHLLDLGLALLVALWVFAISAWLAHSTLSVPVAVFLLLVCAFPLHLARRHGLELGSGLLFLSGALLVLGGLSIGHGVFVARGSGTRVLGKLAALLLTIGACTFWLSR